MLIKIPFKTSDPLRILRTRLLEGKFSISEDDRLKEKFGIGERYEFSSCLVKVGGVYLKMPKNEKYASKVVVFIGTSEKNRLEPQTHMAKSLFNAFEYGKQIQKRKEHDRMKALLGKELKKTREYQPRKKRVKSMKKLTVNRPQPTYPSAPPRPIYGKAVNSAAKDLEKLVSEAVKRRI